MPKEKECYRDQLQRLDEKFPDREMINQKELAEFLGCDPKTIRLKYKHLFTPGLGISKVKVARLIS